MLRLFTFATELDVVHDVCLLCAPASLCRSEEVRHQAISLLAAFLVQGKSVIPPPVDLQNVVAFQEGFDRLFNHTTREVQWSTYLAMVHLS